MSLSTTQSRSGIDFAAYRVSTKNCAVQEATRHQGPNLHGEAGSVGSSQLSEFRRALTSTIENFAHKNIYSMDESGLFFQMQPQMSLTSVTIRGRKKEKECIAVGLCCNMDGSDKHDLIVISKSAKPRCSKRVDSPKLPMRYYANTTAWMTVSIFAACLIWFNLRMHGSKALVQVDNAPSHVSSDLVNFIVEFVPKNTTAFLQPLDAGIIRNFKMHYMSMVLQWLPGQLRGGGCLWIDLLTALQFVFTACERATPNTIRNCWSTTKIMSGLMVATIKSDNEPTALSNLLELESLV